MEAPPVPTSAKKPRITSAGAAHRRHQKNIERDIKLQQGKVSGIVPFTSFSRLVHEVVQGQGDYCVRHEAVLALQEAAESHISQLFMDANNLARYGGRETVGVKDFRFVTDPCEWGPGPVVDTEDTAAFPPGELVQ